MRQIVCDLCGRIPREDEVRYIDITKLVNDEAGGEITSKPCKPAREVCIWCSEEINKRIMEVGNGEENGSS